MQPIHYLILPVLIGALILIILVCRDAWRIARDLRRINDDDGFDQSASRFGYVNEKRGAVMASLPAYLTSQQVANATGYPSAAAFLRDRARLEATTLFPLPMPTRLTRNLRWKADEVLAWVARQGMPAAPGVPIEAILTGKVVMLDMARTA